MVRKDSDNFIPIPDILFVPERKGPDRFHNAIQIPLNKKTPANPITTVEFVKKPTGNIHAPDTKTTKVIHPALAERNFLAVITGVN
jgi:hypothetical protein